MKKTLKRTLTLLLTVVCVASSLGTQTVEAKTKIPTISSKTVMKDALRYDNCPNEYTYFVTWNENYFNYDLGVKADGWQAHSISCKKTDGGYIQFSEKLPSGVKFYIYSGGGNGKRIATITNKDCDEKNRTKNLSNYGLKYGEAYHYRLVYKNGLPCNISLQILPVNFKKFLEEERAYQKKHSKYAKYLSTYCSSEGYFLTYVNYTKYLKENGTKTWNIYYAYGVDEEYKLPTTYNSNKTLKLKKLKANKFKGKFVGWRIGSGRCTTQYLANIYLLKNNRIDKGTYGDLYLYPVYEKDLK